MALCIDTGIPYGNASDISIQDTADVPEVSFSADPHGGLEALWFCFRLSTDSLEPRQPVKLVLKNPQNLLGHLPVTNIRPVYRPEGMDWKRLDAGQVEDQPDGRIRIVWHLDLTAEHTDIAFCYPYGTPEVEQLIEDTNGYWTADVIGVSQGARPLVRLSNMYGKPGSSQTGLVMVTN